MVRVMAKDSKSLARNGRLKKKRESNHPTIYKMRNHSTYCWKPNKKTARHSLAHTIYSNFAPDVL